MRQDLDTPYSGTEALPNPDGRRTLQDAAFLTADYGFTERINLGMLIPYRSSRSRGRLEGEVEGLGDIGLSARFAFSEPHSPGPKVNGIALMSLPTGEVETGFLDENMVLGVGAVALGAGFEVIHDRPGRGSAFLRVVGSKPAGTSDGGVRFGGSLSASAGYGRPFVAGGRIRWALSGGVSWNEEDREDGLAVPNRGGRLAFATAGLSFPLGSDFELSAGAQSLVAADLRGDQLAPEWSGFAALRWTRLVRDKSARPRGQYHREAHPDALYATALAIEVMQAEQAVEQARQSEIGALVDYNEVHVRLRSQIDPLSPADLAGPPPAAAPADAGSGH